MKYILKNLILEGQFQKAEGHKGTQKISVVTGIEGDEHNFLRTNTFDVELDTTKSIEENEGVLQQAALDFIATNYPGTV